jgi:RimJ/RimL family protein N-acetyltransferase
MQKTFEKQANFTTRRIYVRDGDAYSDYFKSLKNPHFEGYLQDKNLDDPEVQRAFFDWIDEQKLILFGAFDGEKMIGQTGLYFADINGENVAVFAGSQRRDEYRRMGVGDALYEVRKQYLREAGFTGRVITNIWENNRESQAAAGRHGFAKTGEVSEYGQEVLELRGLV